MAIYTPNKSSDSNSESSSLRVVLFGNEFPSDDLQGHFRRLYNLSKDRNHPLLARFFNEATYFVKQEISTLTTDLRRLIPSFQTVLQWAEDIKLREGSLTGAIEAVLLVVLQLGYYICYHETISYDKEEYINTSLAGLGIGLLSSIAVSLSPTLSHLPLAGADAVRIAFRLGIHVVGISQILEARDPSSEKPASWAYVVQNVDAISAQEELDAVFDKAKSSASNKLFISAMSQTCVTISGPPSRLKVLFNKSALFRTSRFSPLPVYGGLCHAPHIYSAKDTDSVVRGSSLLHTVQENSLPVFPVYSTSTGIPFLAKTAAESFSCAVSELLTKPICWDNVVRGLSDSIHCTGASAAALDHFGNSLPLHDLDVALKGVLHESQVTLTNIISAGPASSWPRDITPRRTGLSKLAIVGMSCRLPGGANDTEKFWDILVKGLDVSRKIPADRFNIDTHFDPTGKQLNKSMTQYGCFIDEPGLFDAPFFNMSPRESQTTDPQMRLSLVTAYEALEQAGFVGDRTDSTKLDRVGTYYGQAADDYREVNQGQEVGTYYIPGGCRAFGPGRINYFFKFSGPSYSIDTACSSGLAAIEVACQGLWSGVVDTAVAGGVNVLTNPDGFAGLCHGHFLTKGHTACKTWDSTADGYCRAEGIGSVVIKRLEDAEADNDNILGVILGAGTNHSAEAVSITHPHAGHQAYLSRQVLRQAGVDPLDVSYVELHGTGTQAGDHEEMQGIMEVYAPLVKRRAADNPLHIGAVKANLGHGESVAGTTALIKLLLMFQKRAIPPHIGIKGDINPKFPKDFSKRNLHIPAVMTSWQPRQGDRKRVAVVNNFGAAGGNTTMVLEEGPMRIRNMEEKDPRRTHIVSVSAKTKSSLAGNIERLIEYLDRQTDTVLADLSYTTTARRHQHSYRVAMAVSNTQDLKKQLSVHLDKVDAMKATGKSGPPTVAFAFTGQGASHKSMNLALYHDVPSFRDHIQKLDSLAQVQGFPTFIPAVDGSHPQDHEHSAVVTQLALVCTEIATARYWFSLGVKPDVVVGHSLGEYAAMHIAGVISASDTIFMVGRRAQLLQEKCNAGSHSMVAVRASLAEIKQATSDSEARYSVACINGPSDTVLSGTQEAVHEVTSRLELAGFRCTKLDVAFAFHSEQTDAILDDFEDMVKTTVSFHEPRMPVISPLLGKVVFDGKTLNASYVRRATREPVDFISAMQTAQKMSTISEETVWIEIGPHMVCANFIKKILPSTKLALPSMRRDADNWKTISESLAALHNSGVEICWNEFHGPFERNLRLLDLPAYAWNNKTYWMQYVGDWCLTKGNTFYGTQENAVTASSSSSSLPAAVSSFRTSTVQSIIEEKFEGAGGKVVMQSDLMHPDFYAAADGHRMNDCAVVTSSIHADIAFTLADYLLQKLLPASKNTKANIKDLVVTKGLVAKRDKTSPQLLRVTAQVTDIRSHGVSLTWQNVDNDGITVEDEAFATATMTLGNADEWLSSWSPMAHLVHSRIETLERLVADGTANRFSRAMAYGLFAKNLVDYADKYRGMQSVVMHGLEGFANVRLTDKESGVWTVPPHFIDSVAHLAGFIMNCSDAIDTKNNYCVTPGWKAMQFAKPLIPGARYQSYVKMIPQDNDPTIYMGDVYILQDSVIMGKVEGIQFRRYPRLLLDRFFSPPDKATATATTATKKVASASVVPKPGEAKTQLQEAAGHKPVQQKSPAVTTATKIQPIPTESTTAAAEPSAPAPVQTASDTVAAKALILIANEAAMDLSQLQDDAGFAELGIDSLMSLVIAEKFRIELDVKVSGSLFLDYPTIGDLRKWLEEYYS
ncbi:Type I Iterative PKS [Claviceps maximensis]|nr:Type I Iterative PKS [Claviceps maximensis]